MGRGSSIVVSLFALALSIVAAAALDAGKIAAINKAANRLSPWRKSRPALAGRLANRILPSSHCSTPYST